RAILPDEFEIAAVHACCEGATLIIHPIPNRSSSMPKRGDQKVFVSGIFTCPPLANALKARSASDSVATESESEKPSKLTLSVEQPSDAITVVWPTRKLACMILFSKPAGTAPGGGGSGLSLKRIIISTSAPSALR